MEKKKIEVVVLKPLTSDTPKDQKANSSKTKPTEAEVGGRYLRNVTTECPNGHIFFTWADTDFWRTVECPYDGITWQIEAQDD